MVLDYGLFRNLKKEATVKSYSDYPIPQGHHSLRLLKSGWESDELVDL